MGAESTPRQDAARVSRRPLDFRISRDTSAVLVTPLVAVLPFGIRSLAYNRSVLGVSGIRPRPRGRRDRAGTRPRPARWGRPSCHHPKLAVSAAAPRCRRRAGLAGRAPQSGRLAVSTASSTGKGSGDEVRTVSRGGRDRRLSRDARENAVWPCDEIGDELSSNATFVVDVSSAISD